MLVFLRHVTESKKKSALDCLLDLARTTKDPTAAYLGACALAQSGRMVDAANAAQGKSSNIVLHVFHVLFSVIPELVSYACVSLC